MKWNSSYFLLFALFTVITQVKAATLSSCLTEQCVNYFNQYKSSARKGHPQAIAMLAEFYYHGYGVEKNKELALKNYLKAAYKGNTAAQYKSGLLLMLESDNQDISKALQWLKKAASSHYKDSNYLISRLYLTDEYKIKDLEAADHYLAIAYASNQYDALMFVAELPPTLIKQLPKTGYLAQQHSKKTPLQAIEVITVNSTALETIFDAQLSTYRQPLKSTGSRINGLDCEKIVGCYKLSSMQEVGDFLF